MSFRSDHVVVPFATFVEHRERRNGIAATLRKRDRNDAAVKKSPSALAVAIRVADGHTTLAATRKEQQQDQAATKRDESASEHRESARRACPTKAS